MVLDKFTFLIGIYEKLQVDDIGEKWSVFVKAASVIVENNDVFYTEDISDMKHIVNIIEEDIFKEALLELILERSFMTFIILRNFLKEKYDEETTFKMIDEFYSITQYYCLGQRQYDMVDEIITEYISKEKINSADKKVSNKENMRVIKKKRLEIKSTHHDDVFINDDLPF